MLALLAELMSELWFIDGMTARSSWITRRLRKTDSREMQNCRSSNDRRVGASWRPMGRPSRPSISPVSWSHHVRRAGNCNWHLMGQIGLGQRLVQTAVSRLRGALSMSGAMSNLVEVWAKVIWQIRVTQRA